MIASIPVSVLDLAPIAAGTDAAEAFRRSLELARHAESLGYHRFWLAEHHNMPGIASSATAIVIAHVAAGTSRIRVGAGGIMLPNHSPLVVAEQFGTLESLFPGRIDLGLGRAPGTDRETMMALRRDALGTEDDFPEHVQELRAFLGPPAPGQRVHAVPGEGLRVPIWLLGSSGFSARLAAALGLPFAFASHFAPDYLLPALEVYRREFRRSESLDRPYTMAALNVVAADEDRDARRWFTSVQQQFINLRRGAPTQLPPPVDSMNGLWTDAERAMVEHTLRYAVVGSADTVRTGVHAFLEQTSVDELLVTAHIFDQGARLRSFEIIAETIR
jgi:luciferase family oxidoreductase group 1